MGDLGAGEVWVSRVNNNSNLGVKQGFQTKFYGEDWPEAKEIPPSLPEHSLKNMKRCGKGELMKRDELPEASFVFNETQFNRRKDFLWARGFIVVRGTLAKILSDMDFGPGGLVPYTFYEADKVKALDEEFFLLNIGNQKSCWNLGESQNLRPIFTKEHHGVDLYSISTAEDGDVAVNQAALTGTDIWVDPGLHDSIFMSGRLARAILKAKVKPDLWLQSCRVVKGA